MSKHALHALALAAIAAACLTAAASAGIAAGAAPAGTLDLRAPVRMVSVLGGECPPGVPLSTECPRRTGQGMVRGLGRVSYEYSYLVDLAAAGCQVAFVRVLGYPVRISVAGKGELDLAVHEVAECVPQLPARARAQSFTITGGTGIYVGASGGGTVTRSMGSTATGVAGTETWTGTLDVPGLEFDVTPPQLSGARSRTVRVPRRASSARVAFRVNASDDRDGAVPVTCTPRSGSRFKIGRTTVACSASDTSGNTATARFRITVRRGR